MISRFDFRLQKYDLFLRNIVLYISFLYSKILVFINDRKKRTLIWTYNVSFFVIKAVILHSISEMGK